MSWWQKFQIIHITSKNGPIRTLFEKSWLTDADARGGVGSMRTRGEGGQKLAKFCGRLLWMAPKFVLERLRQRLSVYHDSLECKVGSKSTSWVYPVLRSSYSRVCGHLNYTVCLAPLVLPSTTIPSILLRIRLSMSTASWILTVSGPTYQSWCGWFSGTVWPDRFPAQDTSDYEELKFNCKKYIYNIYV